jgi:hypothetical protein
MSAADPSGLAVRYLAVRLAHAERAGGSAAAAQAAREPSGRRKATADEAWFARQAFTATAKLGVGPFTLLLVRTARNRFGTSASERSWAAATVKSAIDKRVTISPPEDFDEGLYLKLNKDVAHAVQSGVMSSGFFHFVRYGAKEGRPRPNKKASPVAVERL